MGMTEETTFMMMIPQRQQTNKNSFDSMSSTTYTPKKKKQKIHGSRPPLAPTKTKSQNTSLYPRQVEEESRCEQQVLATRSYANTSAQHRDASEMAGPRLGDTIIKDTLAPWNSPYANKKKTDDFPRYLLEEAGDEQMLSLDGLDLLETMSFDEYDYRQDDHDDQSLSYSVISEG